MDIKNTSRLGGKNHNDMINRDKPDQHPIEAISGWEELTNEELEEIFKNGGNDNG